MHICVHTHAHVRTYTHTQRKLPRLPVMIQTFMLVFLKICSKNFIYSWFIETKKGKKGERRGGRREEEMRGKRKGREGNSHTSLGNCSLNKIQKGSLPQDCSESLPLPFSHRSICISVLCTNTFRGSLTSIVINYFLETSQELILMTELMETFLLQLLLGEYRGCWTVSPLHHLVLLWVVQTSVHNYDQARRMFTTCT